MPIQISIPADCTECEHGDKCKSYFGGSMCRYEKVLNEISINKTLGRDSENLCKKD